MGAWALDSASRFVLLTRTDAPVDRLVWLNTSWMLGILALVPWGVFVAALGTAGARPFSGPLRRMLVLTGALLVAVAGSPIAVGVFEIAPVDGPFYATRIAPAGRIGLCVELVVTIGILAGLEGALRASSGDVRRRTKYLVLGLGGIFLMRFYLLGQEVLFNVVLGSHLSTAAATLAIGNVLIGVALARDRLGSEFALSRRVVYRSVAVGVLGVYLLALALLGVVFDRLEITQELFWGSIVVFVSALGLAAVMLSEAVRWRIKTFVVTNFYRSKYDYRDQWATFTKRLGSLLTVEQLAPALLQGVVETVGATAGRLLLEDSRDGRYHLVAGVGVPPAEWSLAPGVPLISAFRTGKGPVVVGESWPADQLDLPLEENLGDGAIVVPLRRRDNLAGIMIVGPERAGAAWTGEDVEFLSTVGEQAASAILTARVSESLAEAREFEAFTRLTSFVIHDLKNAVSALSMLSQNALRHFDDPEFQRDALATLARTVDRMTTLMDRLASPETQSLRSAPVDLSGLAVEACQPLAGGSRIAVVLDLGGVPPVQGDAHALQKVATNLVTNAAQSIAGEGVITLRTHVDSGCVVLSVSDTGCGMSDAFIRRSLFSPFRTTKKGGWGLGLFHVKGIVEAHGGAIDVVSKPGVGSTFRVSLPVHREGMA
jgi:putative PEP-CTERM system histidine kinase